MKNLLKLKWIFVLFITLLVAQACKKDDPAEQITPATTTETDSTKDGTDSTNGTNNSNTTDGITSEKVSEEGQITLYKVDGGNITKETDFTVTGSSLEYQKDTAKHEEIWALVKKIMPREYLAKLNQFVIFSSEVEGTDTNAFVIQTSDDSSTWQLGVAIDKAYMDGFNTDGDFGYVLVHELAHIITLDNLQVDFSITDVDCQNYFPGNGCSKKESYINIFYNQFWADIWNEFSNLKKDGSEQEAFYEKYKDRFVSQYAATNPGEDIAEVFATFVTEDEIQDVGVAKKKIELMSQQPQLVEIRNFIRGNTTFAKGGSYLPTGSSKRANIFSNTNGSCTHRSR